MKKINILALLLCFVLMFSSVGCHVNEEPNNNELVYSQTVIAENGNTNYTIVIPEDATETESYAGEILSEYLNKVTKANFRVVTEDKIAGISTKMKLISVGETKLMAKAGLDYSNIDFNLDGFIQKTVDNTMFLCGGDSDKSDLYAVYDYLEKCLGVKFFAPDCEVVPEANKIYLPTLDVVDIPAFKHRAAVTHVLEQPDFQGKTRMMGMNLNHEEKYGESYNDYVGGQHHNIANFVIPSNIWQDTHPEWYYITENGQVNFNVSNGLDENGNYDEELLVNPIDVAADSFKDLLLNTDCYYLNFSYADAGAFPTNNEYLALAEKFSDTGVVILFINNVIEKIDEWIETATDEDGNKLFPNGRDYSILWLAYSSIRHAPMTPSGEKLVELNEKICVWDAPIQVNVLYSINDSRQYSDAYIQIPGWVKMTNNHAIWDYHGHFTAMGLYWVPFLSVVQDYYEYYQKQGIHFVFSQITGWEQHPDAAQQFLQVYVMSKLMWDPNRYNVSQLVEEFMMAYYGEYGEEMLQVVTMLEDNFAVLQNQENKFFNHSSLNWAQFYPLSLLMNSISIIEDAIEDNKNSNLSEKDKLIMESRLKSFLAMMYAPLANEYGSYYGGDMTNYSVTADKFYHLLVDSGWIAQCDKSYSGKVYAARFKQMFDAQ